MEISTLVNKQICQFLSFYLTSDIQAMLPTEQISAVLNVAPNQIVPIFEVQTAIMGVYNHRGEVLWIADLGCLVGLNPLFVQNVSNTYSVMVIRQQNKMLGLAVRQMGQLVVCNAAQIQPSINYNLPPRLTACLKGEKQSPDGKGILVIDGGKILQLLSR